MKSARESVMRNASIFLALALFAVPVLAQEAQHPPVFSAEEWQQLMGLQQKIGDALNNLNYADGLKLLREQLPIIESALERVEAGEVEGLGDKKDMWVQILTGGHPQVPGLAHNYYNQACCCSKLGKTGEALDALEKAIGHGYLDIDHMNMDSDLDPIRGEARYKSILGSLTYNEVFETYVAPTAGDGPSPLILVLHERGGNEKKAIEQYKTVADRMKAVMVAPRAPLNGGADRYGWQKTTSDDEDGLRKISFALEKALAEHQIDAAKIYVVGDRQGGKFATLFALSNPGKVAGAVAINGYWNKYYYEDFLADAKARGLKLAFVHGKTDPQFDRTSAGVKQVEEREIPAKMFPYEGGSELPEDITTLVVEAIRWMQG